VTTGPEAMFRRFRWIWVVAGAAALLAGAFWLGTLQQPLIDHHEFRQTQTALSALFMQPGLDGLLNYQTPVVGAPWSIPFEFPLFQWLSHKLANLTGLNLSSSGRLVSVLFGVGCLWPASRLMRQAGFGGTSIAVLILLYCTSSIYLYWNRAFLMESTALFFTLVSLDCYSQIRLERTPGTPKLGLVSSGLALTLAISLVVKATTALPALALMGVDWIWQTHQTIKTHRRLWRQLFIASALAVAFALLFSWTHHADALKQLNPIGADLTSSALKAWNFGQPGQRLHAELWDGVVLQRMLFPMAALPITGLVTAGVWSSREATRTFLLASLALAIAPLLIFTNLHIVHTYYQASNQIFLLMAVAGSAEILLYQHGQRPWKPILVLASLTIITIANLHNFSTNYWLASQQQSSDRLIIGNLIQRYTPTESAILVIGDDWSSAYAYHSKRRAFTQPNWAVRRSAADVLRDPQTALDGSPLGAVVSKQPVDARNLEPGCRPRKQEKLEGWHVIFCDIGKVASE